MTCAPRKARSLLCTMIGGLLLMFLAVSRTSAHGDTRQASEEETTSYRMVVNMTGIRIADALDSVVVEPSQEDPPTTILGWFWSLIPSWEEVGAGLVNGFSRVLGKDAEGEFVVTTTLSFVNHPPITRVFSYDDYPDQLRFLGSPDWKPDEDEEFALRLGSHRQCLPNAVNYQITVFEHDRLFSPATMRRDFINLAWVGTLYDLLMATNPVTWVADEGRRALTRELTAALAPAVHFVTATVSGVIDKRERSLETIQRGTSTTTERFVEEIVTWWEESALAQGAASGLMETWSFLQGVLGTIYDYTFGLVVQGMDWVADSIYDLDADDLVGKAEGRLPPRGGRGTQSLITLDPDQSVQPMVKVTYPETRTSNHSDCVQPRADPPSQPPQTSGPPAGPPGVTPPQDPPPVVTETREFPPGMEPRPPVITGAREHPPGREPPIETEPPVTEPPATTPPASTGPPTRISIPDLTGETRINGDLIGELTSIRVVAVDGEDIPVNGTGPDETGVRVEEVDEGVSVSIGSDEDPASIHIEGTRGRVSILRSDEASTSAPDSPPEEVWPQDGDIVIRNGRFSENLHFPRPSSRRTGADVITDAGDVWPWDFEVAVSQTAATPVAIHGDYISVVASGIELPRDRELDFEITMPSGEILKGQLPAWGYEIAAQPVSALHVPAPIYFTCAGLPRRARVTVTFHPVEGQTIEPQRVRLVCRRASNAVQIATYQLSIAGIQSFHATVEREAKNP